MQTESTNRQRIYVDELVPELRGLMRKGLPATLSNAGDMLPNLRNVVSRATYPDDPMSRIDSLTSTVTAVIEGMAEDKYGPAALIMFGLAPKTQGVTLTLRREKAAATLGYDLDHFRKRVEARILFALAEAIFRDMVRYRAGLRRPVDAYEVPRPTPNLTQSEVTYEEEQISRIWACLYKVRAERIAGLLAEGEGSLERAQEYRNAEEHAAHELDRLTRAYIDRFGREYIKLGDLDYSIVGLERLVVWHDDALVEYHRDNVR